MATSNEVFLSAVASGDTATIETYFMEDAVRVEIAFAEDGYRRSLEQQLPLRNNTTNPWDRVRLHRRSVGAECLVGRKVPFDVLAWFFSPQQTPKMDSMLAHLFVPIASRAVYGCDVEAVELMLSSHIFVDVLALYELQQRVLHDLLRRAWNVSSMDMITVLFAHGAECQRAFARDFIEGPLGLVKSTDDYAVLFAHGIPEVGGHEFRASITTARFWLSRHIDRIKFFSRWDPSIITSDILHVAAMADLPHTMDLALEVGFVDVDARGLHGRTSLMIVAGQLAKARPGHPDRLMAGDLETTGIDGRVTLSDHYFRRIAECSPTRRHNLSTLLEYSADPNLQDEHGKTALHHAVKCNCLEATAKLLEAGANIHMRTSLNKSVLDQLNLRHIAREAKQELFLLLVNHGASPFTVGKKGKSVLDRLRETEAGAAFVLANQELFKAQQEPFA